MVEENCNAHAKARIFILGKIIVGSSKSEWSLSNIRFDNQIEVYQTNENISWQLNTSPTYWGEVPKVDTTATDPL